MPIKLTARDRRLIVVAVAVMVVSLAIGVKYFWRAFPEAAIEFRVNRDSSLPIAAKFLAERGVRVEGYRHAAIFDYDDQAKVYLERTQGLERMNSLTRGPLRLWRWSHRWFRPQQQEEFRVDVTPAGDVVGFAHEIPEAAPGANLDPVSARAIAETFLREVVKRDLGELEFVEPGHEKRPARTDHTFTWKQKSVNLGDGSLRIEVEVDGDQVAAYAEFVKIPEQWRREYEKLRSRNRSAQLVAEVLLIVLSIAILVILVRRLRDRDVPVKLAVGLGLVAAVLYFLGELNTFALQEFDYRTTDSYASFITGYLRDSLLSSLGIGALIFLLVASSEPVYREGYPHLVSLRRYLTWQGLRSRSFFLANVIGISLTFFFFAYQTVFYLVADRLGAWAPADVPFSNLLNTRIPWVSVLFIGFFPAVSEEMQFRAFAIPFLGKILRSRPAALVLAAFIWGFLHAAYPNQPFFIRGVEVGLGGIVVGLIMLRFGILATLIWHYSVDALYTAFLLLRSPNHYLMVSGALTAGIMLLPLIAALVAYWRRGTFADETALTNESVGVSRAAKREGVVAPGLPLSYQPLSRRRLALATALVAAFLSLTLLPVHRFGEGIGVRLTREEAIKAADEYLKQRQVDPGRYHRVAWLRENVDPLAVKYILQYRSVEETDHIYRQATRLLLWDVRYFRPLEKEEHLIFVDAAAGGVFAYRHLLDENAPGATLSAEEARARAAAFLEQQGYRLANFELQETKVEKRKARTDYTLVWQAKPSKPGSYMQVGDACLRLEVTVTGDEVTGLTRRFKLPEEWERRESALTLPNALLLAALTLVMAGIVAGGIVLFVKQVRSGEIQWRRSAALGAAVVGVVGLAELNQLSRLYQAYSTSESLATFWISSLTGLVVFPILLGLAGWPLMGLAASLYPNAWLVFRGTARRVWRRDAAIAIVVSLAAAVGLGQLNALIAARFHAYAPVQIDLVPDLFDASWPGAGFVLRGVLLCCFVPAMAAVLIYLFRYGWARRAWWLWVAIPFLVVALGPPLAHSRPEFLVGWAMRFLALIVAAGVVATFFRDNVLAYLGAAFCLPLVRPLVELLLQPAAFFRWNGVLLALLALVFVGWMLSEGREASSAA